MNSSNFAKTSNRLLPVLIAVVASCWLLSSLGNGMLWQDEAQTALLGRTTLHHGVPLGMDGPNSLSQEKGAEFGSDGLWRWHTWFPFYLLAGFYKCFGESTAISRLPFALFGVATVVLSFFTARLLWADVKSALLSSGLLLACVPFVLLVRQCRYYAPCMFFSLLMLDAFFRICRGSRFSWIVLAFAGALLFESHFLYLATTFAAISFHAAIWHRNQWKPLFLAALLTGVLCAPHAIWLSGLDYGNYSHRGIKLPALFFQLKTYSKQIGLYIFPWPLIVIPLFAVAKRALGHQKLLPAIADLEPWALPIILSVVTIAMLAPTSPLPYFRYIAPLIPPLMLLLGRAVVISFRIDFAFGVLVVILLGWWWPARKYIYELRHPFIGPVEGIVQLLTTRGQTQDIVVTSYDDLPLKFYLKNHVAGGLTGEELSKIQSPRWLILRRVPASSYEYPIRDFISRQLKIHDYQRIVLTGFPDTKYENREEPDQHMYSTSMKTPPVVVYELKR